MAVTDLVSGVQVLASVDASLARLGTDHIDLLQIHWPDRYVPLFGSTRYEVGKERADDISFEEQARPVTDVTGVTASPSRSRRAQSELEPLREPTPASAPSPSPSPSLSSPVAVCFRSRRA